MDTETTEETQEQSEVTPPIETTDNQAEVEQLRQEKLKAEQALTRQGHKLSRYEKQVQDLDLVKQQLEDSEAERKDIIEMLKEMRGDIAESPRISHVEELRKRREQSLRKEPAEVPGAVKFTQFVEDKGLTMDSPIVAKAIAGTESAEEAITKLNTILSEETDSKVNKRIADEVKAGVAQALKEMGVTKSEGGPSGSSQSDDDFIKSYSEGKSDDHARAKKIMSI